MEAWLIVLITVGCGLALFAGIFFYKTKQEKLRQANLAVNQTTTGVHVVANQSTPYNPYLQQQPNQIYYQPQMNPQQGQTYLVNTSIPSTANQGAFNARHPQQPVIINYNPSSNLVTKTFINPAF